MKKVQTIKFRDFMDESYKQPKMASPMMYRVSPFILMKNKKKKEKGNVSPNINMYSVSPFVMIDPIICLMGVGLLSIALLEKFFEHQGYYDAAESLNTFFNIAVPCVAFGFIWKLMITVSGAFL